MAPAPGRGSPGVPPFLHSPARTSPSHRPPRSWGAPPAPSPTVRMVGLHLQADLEGTQAGNKGVRQDPTSICTVAPQTGGGLSEASLDSSGSAHSLFGKDSVSAFQVGPFSDSSCLGFSDTEALLGSALGLSVHAELLRVRGTSPGLQACLQHLHPGFRGERLKQHCLWTHPRGTTACSEAPQVTAISSWQRPSAKRQFPALIHC